MISESAQPGARRFSALRRAVLRLLACGLFLLLAAAGWFAWGFLWSGRLALAQPAPSTDIPRGFDFGPVWLESGVSGRYFIRALVPETQGAPWYTSFEILDARRQPVQRQEEMRYVGDYQFEPGKRETFSGTFSLAEATGYYYFRFQARNGDYSPLLNGPPVLEFSLRQNVISGLALWLPAIGLALFGLGCLAAAGRQIGRLGQSESRQQAAETAWNGQTLHGRA